MLLFYLTPLHFHKAENYGIKILVSDHAQTVFFVFLNIRKF